MRVLAFDTSQLDSAACVFEGQQLLAGAKGQTKTAHSEGLLGLIDQVLAQSKNTLKMINMIAVGVGPGSFTGLRVGLSTAKALAQLEGLPLLPIPSLEVLACSSEPDLNGLIYACNAYQGQLFVGFAAASVGWCDLVISPETWNEVTQLPRERPLQIAGNGARSLATRLEQLGVDAVLLNENLEIQPAGLHQAALQNVFRGTATVSYCDLGARYLKLSAAEEKFPI